MYRLMRIVNGRYYDITGLDDVDMVHCLLDKELKEYILNKTKFIKENVRTIRMTHDTIPQGTYTREMLNRLYKLK